MGITKITSVPSTTDSVSLKPIGIVGKSDVNNDVTINTIDPVRYDIYQPQISTKAIPFLDTDTAYTYFDKLKAEIETITIIQQEYYQTVNYASIQLLNHYSNVNSPDGNITLRDLLNIVKTTYVALNDVIQFNDGSYRTIMLNSAEQITLAMGKINEINGIITTVEAGIDIKIDEIKAYVNNTYKDAESSINTLNQVIVDTQGITLSAIQDKLDAYGNYVYRNYTSLNVFNDKIATLVGRQEFDEYGNRLRECESNIEQTSSQIALKVSQSDFNSLDAIVGKHESSITMLAAEITSKVSGTDFDDLGRVVGEHSSTIQQLNNKIDLKVDSPEYNATKDIVTKNVSDILIESGRITSAVAETTRINNIVTSHETSIQQTTNDIRLLVSANGVIQAGVIVDAINNGTVTIAGNKINIDGTTVFATGFNPSKKNTVFIQTPVPPYREGDTWLRNNEYYTSSVTRLTGEIDLNDWYKSTKYTDDSVANTMSTTYRQVENPAANWLTDIDKDNHINDHWIVDDPAINTNGPVNKIYAKNFINGIWEYSWELDNTIIDGGRIIANQVLAKNIYASGASIGGFIIGYDVDGNEYLRTSNQYNPNPTTDQQGIWMGKQNGTHKFFIGNATEYIVFNGNNLIISGYTRLGDNSENIQVDTLFTLAKYFKLCNPGQANEYIQILSSVCATGTLAAYRSL